MDDWFHLSWLALVFQCRLALVSNGQDLAPLCSSACNETYANGTAHLDRDLPQTETPLDIDPTPGQTPPRQRPPYGKERAVRTLLECILVPLNVSGTNVKFWQIHSCTKTITQKLQRNPESGACKFSCFSPIGKRKIHWNWFWWSRNKNNLL